MRRSKGWSKGPCPGCQTGEHHPSGSVCQECRQLLDLGRKTVESERAIVASEAEQPYEWAERPYAWARYYGDYEDRNRKTLGTLGEAMFALVNALSRRLSDPSEVKFRRAAEEPVIGDEIRDWAIVVLMTPAMRGYLQAVDQAIRDALTAVYNQGKRDGASLLRQLANGEIAMDAFDEGLLTREERNRRRS